MKVYKVLIKEMEEFLVILNIYKVVIIYDFYIGF